MFSAHDADGIRQIQDALNCCGFRTTKDQSWPFPKGSHPDKDQCANQFGRTQACMVPWGKEMKKAMAGELGVVLAVGLVRVLLWATMRNRDLSGMRRGGGRGWNWNWKELVDKIFGGNNNNNNRHGCGNRDLEDGNTTGARRGLLTAVDEEDEEEDRVDGNVNGARDGGRLFGAADSDGGYHGSEERYQQGGVNGGGYGTAGGSGPRVEVSHHERGPWE